MRYRLRVAGKYGEEQRKGNGIMQGCSKSILDALMYRTIQFRCLDERHPRVSKAAFVDGRTQGVGGCEAGYFVGGEDG